MTSGHNVLIFTPEAEYETEMYRRLMPALVRFECDVERVPDGVSVFEMVERTTFDLIVIGYPIEQPPLPALLKSIRWRESASRNTPVLLVSAPIARGLADEYINRGVNRVILESATDWEFENAVGALLEVEPRISMTLPVKLGLPLAGKIERVVAQADNLSTTGMLIRGRWEVEVGAPLTFEFTPPGRSAPLSGTAEVVRTTTREREGLIGFAIQYVRFDGDGAERISQFIAERTTDPMVALRETGRRWAAGQN
jgi:hypothetical protein